MFNGNGIMSKYMIQNVHNMYEKEVSHDFSI